MAAAGDMREQALCLGWDVGGWMGRKDGLAAGVLLENGGFHWLGATHRCGLGPLIAAGDLSLAHLLELVQVDRPVESWRRIIVGVDAPLGFPAAFVAAAAASIEQLEPLGAAAPDRFIDHSLAFRETDRIVHCETGASPFSPSLDSLTNNATKARAACAQLRLGAAPASVIPQEHDDLSVAMIEVYPATWGRIKEKEPPGTPLAGWFADADAATHPDERDAMLCALAAAAYEHTRRGASAGPLPHVALPPEDNTLASTEGWIYWPRLSADG